LAPGGIGTGDIGIGDIIGCTGATMGTDVATKGACNGACSGVMGAGFQAFGTKPSRAPAFMCSETQPWQKKFVLGPDMAFADFCDS